MKTKGPITILSAILIIAALSFSCSAGIPKIEEQEEVLEDSSTIETMTDKERTLPVADAKPLDDEENGKIIFAAEDATLIEFLSADYMSNNILLISNDGRLIKRITDDDNNNYGPIFSPDRQRIVYSSNAYGVYDIYLINNDGSGLKNITQNNYQDYSPDWSPYGQKISYVSDETGNNDLYIINADGTNKTQLVKNEAQNYNPLWSPDGERILYISDEQGPFNIYSISADGTDIQKLTDDEYFAQSISLSPDGSQVLYEAYEMVSTVQEIFLLDMATLQVKILTETLCYTTMPLWVLNGSRIVFNSIMDDYFDIYIMDPDGSNLEKLTDNKKDNHLITVSEDGLYIFYQIFESDDVSSLWVYDLKTGQTKEIDL